MNTYVAEWKDKDGSYCVSFDAIDWQAADRIANKKGWRLLGQYIDEGAEEIDAMIELQIDMPSIH